MDNEASAQGDARLPGKLASFIGNLSAALHGAGFRLVVDVTSTWHGNIAGPEYLPLYGRAAAPSTVFMDMATYFNTASTIDAPAGAIFGYWEAWAPGKIIHCLKTHLGRSGPWLRAHPPGCPL